VQTLPSSEPNPKHTFTRADARRAIFAWINWYNRTRLHSTLAYRSPLEWEQKQADAGDVNR
jgi:transposase InsO family protein